MLTTLQKGVCAFAVATTLLATSAQADDQTVMIMDLGYFPTVVNVGLGDSITFTNNSTAEHTLAGPAESWTSDPIPVNGIYVLEITEETPASYSGMGAGGEMLEGSFTNDIAETND